MIHTLWQETRQQQSPIGNHGYQGEWYFFTMLGEFFADSTQSQLFFVHFQQSNKHLNPLRQLSGFPQPEIDALQLPWKPQLSGTS